MSEPSPTTPNPDPTAAVPGQLLGGKYRLIRMLGEGGMGNVWLARNELLDSDVALKIVRPDARGSEATARLLMEARVQANLRHPNVARVFDYGEASNGDSFLVLELLEGYSLAELLEKRGALPPVHAVRILLPVIDALCAAHRAGVVHRDLKPDNIFIARSSQGACPKLLDFGIAKLEGRFDRRLTGNGGVVGSPAYMAPEQARGVDDVDQRVDVWAACVVLYEAVTGKPAFDAENYHALLRNVIESEPAPLTDPACEQLWPIVKAGLAKDRAERTATMRELGAALEHWLAQHDEPGDAAREQLAWHWSDAPRDSMSEMRALTGIRSNLRSLPKSLGASGPRPGRSGAITMRTGEKDPQSQPWRMSVAAAVGGAVLAFAVGQAWLPLETESEPVEEDVAVVRPAAAMTASIAAPLPLPAPARTESAERVAPAPQPTAAVPRAAAKQEQPAKPVAAKPSPTAAAIVAELPPEQAAPRPRLTAADLLALESPARVARRSEPVRLTSAYPRAAGESAATTRGRDSVQTPTPPPPAGVKRRAPAPTSEADLGLKSPW